MNWKAEQIDDLVNRFTQAIIPVVHFESEQRNYVATVFERINRKGVELDIFQLLSVWNWSEDFDLKEKFTETSEDLEMFGFNENGEQHKLLLKCCSAVIMNTANPENFVELQGDEVRQKFEEIKTGIFSAIDFLRTELKVFSVKLLPMENILVVLASFFASQHKQPSPIPEKQYATIKRWFWRSCFSQRYAKGGVKSTDFDIKEIQKLKNGISSRLGDIDISLDSSYFLKNVFNMRSIATKTFILLLANNEPLNFIQGTNVSLENVLSQGNRKEFHHIYPKSYLEKLVGIYKPEQINCLANFSILSRTDNNTIKDRPPSQYRSLMPPEADVLSRILEKSFCPREIFNDDYDTFLKLRSELLLKRAKELC